MRQIQGWERRCLDLYDHWSSGRFPVAGGVLDQAASALEAFQFLDDLFARLIPKEK